MNPEDNSPWQYKPDDSSAPAIDPIGGQTASPPQSRSPESISWEAPEFIEHHHGPGWYGLLIIITAALAAGAYFAAKGWIAAGTIAVVGIIVGIFVAHKPAKASYEINRSGLKVNDKTYKFSDYKSFGVIREGDLSSLTLFPLKRLMPPLSAYFTPADESKIVEALGNYLPYDDRKLDLIDRLSHRLRL